MRIHDQVPMSPEIENIINFVRESEENNNGILI